MPTISPIEVHRHAIAAASAAMAGSPDAGTCGYAWVDIPATANSAFLGALHTAGIGFVANGDLRIFSPGEYSGQSVDVWENGAKAYASVLSEHGIQCAVGSRID